MPTFLEPDDSEATSHSMMWGCLSGLYFVKAAAAWRAASSPAAFFVQSRDAIFLSRDIVISAAAGNGTDDLYKVDE